MSDVEKGKLLAQVLRSNGIAVRKPDQIQLMAQVTCFSLRHGQTPASVIADLSDTTGWSSSDAGFFYGAAVTGFCPEYAPRR